MRTGCGSTTTIPAPYVASASAISGISCFGVGVNTELAAGLPEICWKFCSSPKLRSVWFEGWQSYSAGNTAGTPFFFTMTTTNFAGFVALALRPTVCTSSGPS